MEITDDEFPQLWQDISEALLRIAGQISPTKKTAWQKVIANFLKDPLTAEDERNVQELLRWYRNDMEVKESIEGLKSSAQKLSERVERLETFMRDEVQEIKDQFGELKTTGQGVQSLVREEARDIKDNLGEELKSTTQEVRFLEKEVREELQDIKDQLGEMHQSIDRLSSSADGTQAGRAQRRQRIDCEAISGPGPRTGSSKILATARDPQTDFTAMPVTSFQQQVHVSIAASFGGEIAPNTNLHDTQEVLNLIAAKYFQNVNPSTKEEFDCFLRYLREVRKLIVVDIQPGSLIITVECSSLEILEGLWEDYRTGHLNDMAQKYLVTEDVLKEFGLIEVRLMTTILEDEYRACREYFLQKRGKENPSAELQKSYIAVVAIDFGTSYSGFAFSFTKGQKKDVIFMNRGWTSEDGYRTSKAPTCLLLAPDLTFHSFGYEAMKNYAQLQSEGEERNYFFFLHFKMALHSDKTINTETTIEAVNGRRVKAKTVFAHSIRFLKEEAIKEICQQTGDEYFSTNDMQWVLTVPAIWTTRAEQFMREAAYEAGLGSPDNPEQVMIALEPEAAAICCLEKNMSEFQSEAGCSSVEGLLSQPNTHYMVVDIGGGTLDVTVHAIQDDGNIKEIHKVTGGPFGGIRVNQQFEALLDELLDSRELQSYQQWFPSDWLCLMNEFEGKKKGERILDCKAMTNIRLPGSFVFLANRCWRSRYGEKDVKLIRNEFLALSSEVMKKLFVPVIEDIKKHLRSLQRSPQLSKVTTMLLVGGFADSALLQKAIKSEFSRKFRVLIPNHAAFAVVQGAVMFGKKPSKITERVMRTTFGAGCSKNFIQGVHREENKFVVDGIEMCNGLFNLFVRENDTVRTGLKITCNYAPLRATNTEIAFNFYATSNPDAVYVTDPGMMKIGRVTVHSPDTWRGKDRKIEVSMYFDRTEITVTAEDVSSGNVARAFLDLLDV